MRVKPHGKQRSTRLPPPPLAGLTQAGHCTEQSSPVQPVVQVQVTCVHDTRSASNAPAKRNTTQKCTHCLLVCRHGAGACAGPVAEVARARQCAVGPGPARSRRSATVHQCATLHGRNVSPSAVAWPACDHRVVRVGAPGRDVHSCGACAVRAAAGAGEAAVNAAAAGVATAASARQSCACAAARHAAGGPLVRLRACMRVSAAGDAPLRATTRTG